MPDIIIPTPLNPSALTGVTSTGTLANVRVTVDGAVVTSGGGGGATADRELVTTVWYALYSFTGASRGDTLTLTQIIDVTATPSTVGVVWRNVTTGLDLASAPPASGITNTAGFSPKITSQVSFSRPANTTAYSRGDLVSSSVSPGLPLEFNFPYPGAVLDIISGTSVSIPANAARAESYALDLFVAPPTLLIGDNASLWDPAILRAYYFSPSTISGVTDADYIGRLFSGVFYTEINSSYSVMGFDGPSKTIVIPNNGKIYGVLSMNTDSQTNDALGTISPDTSVSGQTYTISITGRLG